MDHNKDFDGIQQADNPMPPWWVNIFLVCIIFAIGYSIYFHNMSGWKMEDSFNSEVAEHEKNFPQAKVVVSADGSNPFRDNAEAVAAGQKTFQQFCVACHGPEGKGLIGPNLMDAEWLHGDTDAEVYQVVMEGVGVDKTKTGKGPMPAHKQSVGSEKVYQVLAWLASNNQSLKKLK